MALLLASYRDPQIRSNFFTTIDGLINTYFSQDYLTDRLQELPLQFSHPHPRKWAQTDWCSINRDLWQKDRANSQAGEILSIDSFC